MSGLVRPPAGMGERMNRILLGAALALISGTALAQELPAGPPVAIQMVTQLSPTIPQYTRVDIPMLREELPQALGRPHRGDARELAGAQSQRARSSCACCAPGRSISAASRCRPSRATCRCSTSSTSRACFRRTRCGRKVAEAVMPELNKELERFNVRIIATYPFPAQVFFCREPITSLADRQGPARPHARRLAERFHPGDRRPAGRDRLPGSLFGARARRGRLRRHRHRDRQRRALVRGDQAHVRAAACSGASPPMA